MSHNINSTNKTHNISGLSLPNIQYFSNVHAPPYTQSYYTAPQQNVRKEIIQIQKQTVANGSQLIDLTKNNEQKHEHNVNSFNYLKDKIQNLSALEEDALNKLDKIEERLKTLDHFEEKLKKLDHIEEKLKKLDHIEEKLKKLDYMENIVCKLESIQNKFQSVENKISLIDENILLNNDEIKAISEKGNNIFGIHQNILTENKQELKEIKDTNKEIKKTLNDFIQQQKENHNTEVNMNGKEEFRMWLTNEVELPEYLSNFENEGLNKSMDNVPTINFPMLELIGITKLGDKIQIMKNVEKYKNNNSMINTINYFNDPQNIQMEKLSKIHKEKEKKSNNKLNKYKNQMKIIIHQLISVNNPDVDLSKYHRKANSVKQFVMSQFNNTRRKKEKSKTKIIIEPGFEGDKITKDVEKGLKQYLESNEPNSNNPIILNNNKKNEQFEQSKLMEKYKITNHSRIPALNGQIGVRALNTTIRENTVIGEYHAVNMLRSDLDKIENEEIRNEIDRYGFDCSIQCYLTTKQFNCMMDGNMDAIIHYDHIGCEPPSKKRKLNNNNNSVVDDNIPIERKIDIVIDGYNYKPRSVLACINDCRKSLKEPERTVEDEQFYNVELHTCKIDGWPRVFCVALRDIEPHEELMTDYGNYFAEVELTKIKLEKRKQKINEILSRPEIQNEF